MNKLPLPSDPLVITIRRALDSRKVTGVVLDEEPRRVLMCPACGIPWTCCECPSEVLNMRLL